MKSNPFELCSAAFKFRHGTSMQRIVGKQSEHSESTIWSGLRHYIGRLGSWDKARNILVRVATRHPNLIVSFRLEYLRSPRAVAGPAADSHTHLDGVLRRMLPANESLRHKQVLEAIHDNRVVDLSSDFLKHITMTPLGRAYTRSSWFRSSFTITALNFSITSGTSAAASHHATAATCT